MNNDMVFEAIVRETAAKVINSLDKEAREAILIKAVSEILRKKDFGWQISNVLEEEAKAIAKDYIKTPEVQGQIKEKVVEGVAKVMDGLAKAVAKSVQFELKSNYSEWHEGGA